MAGHSPTPWREGEDGRVYDAGGACISGISYGFPAFPKRGDRASLLRAVNHHESLAGTIRDLLDAMEKATPSQAAAKVPGWIGILKDALEGLDAATGGGEGGA